MLSADAQHAGGGVPDSSAADSATDLPDLDEDSDTEVPNALSDDEDAVDEPFEALKTIMENNEAKKAESRQAREQVEREEIEEISTDEPAAPAPTPLINTLKPDLAPDPDDTFPVNTRVQVWWEDPGAWYSGTVNSTQVWRGEKGKSRNPTRQIEVCYDDDATLTHSLHNNKVRKCEEMPSHELMPPSNSNFTKAVLRQATDVTQAYATRRRQNPNLSWRF